MQYQVFATKQNKQASRTHCPFIPYHKYETKSNTSACLGVGICHTSICLTTPVRTQAGRMEKRHFCRGGSCEFIDCRVASIPGTKFVRLYLETRARTHTQKQHMRLHTKSQCPAWFTNSLLSLFLLVFSPQAPQLEYEFYALGSGMMVPETALLKRKSKPSHALNLVTYNIVMMYTMDLEQAGNSALTLTLCHVQAKISSSSRPPRTNVYLQCMLSDHRMQKLPSYTLTGMEKTLGFF